MSGRIDYFATKSDLLSVLEKVECECALKYFPYERSKSPIPEQYSKAQDIPNLGTLKLGQKGEADYVIAYASDQIPLRRSELSDGNFDYTPDFSFTPHWCQFRPGGKVGDRLLIAGEVKTASKGEYLSPIFKLLAKEIKRQFKYVELFWVGTEAFQMLTTGARLTEDVQSPKSVDLKRPRRVTKSSRNK